MLNTARDHSTRLFFALAVAAFARAQTPAAFEVAAVSPNTLNDRVVTIDVGPGSRFAARGHTFVLRMQRPWIRADRFDVNAKAAVSDAAVRFGPGLA